MDDSLARQRPQAQTPALELVEVLAARIIAALREDLAGLREELIKLEEAIRDTAPIGRARP